MPGAYIVRFRATGCRLFALSAILAVVTVGGAQASVAAKTPPWVAHGVQILRHSFYGTPAPTRVRWGTEPGARWVSIDLAASHRVFSHGPRGSVVVGRHATVTWAANNPGGYGIRIR
jgi:hypothetical protein